MFSVNVCSQNNSKYLKWIQIKFLFSPKLMSNTKETINEEQNTDKHIVIQPKPAISVSKRKLVDISVNEIKHVKVVEEKIEVTKQVCAFCNKALKFISTFTCRCQKSFCSKHRFHDQHNCTYDYKAGAKSKLMELNPKITPRKISE